MSQGPTDKKEPITQAELDRKLADITREVQAVFERHDVSIATALIELGGVVFEVDHNCTLNRKLGIMEFCLMGFKARLDGIFAPMTLPPMAPPPKPSGLVRLK